MPCRAVDGYSGFNGLFGENKAGEMASLLGSMLRMRLPGKTWRMSGASSCPLIVCTANDCRMTDIFAAQGNAIAGEAIRQIAELYAVEKEARGKPPAERVALRQSKAKLVFGDLEAWLHAQLPKVSGKSPLAQAIHYRQVIAAQSPLGAMPWAGCRRPGRISKTAIWNWTITVPNAPSDPLPLVGHYASPS
ncbi:hypothetical protein AB838_08385 [Rhodobacteraceae bacterium (ex Bugula neritina AB1)]|nr:hypothetical protein AB838_08385 [Rhodobacteraceae bacterium (ex Bugula neritina AB1)]